MKSQLKIAVVVLLSSLTFSTALHAQFNRVYVPSTPKYTPSTPSYTPRPSSQTSTQRQSTSTPRPAAPQTPRPAPSTSSTPQHQTYPSQTQTPRSSTPSQSQTSRPIQTHIQSQAPRQTNRPAQPSKEQQKQAQNQVKEQVRQQKQLAKRQQEQQKEQARQQKEEAKNKAKQEKEQMKREQNAQKEAARHPKINTAETAANTPGHSTVSTPSAESLHSSTPKVEAGSIYRMPSGSAISGKTPSGAATLTREGSQSVVNQVNSSRSRMSGINSKALPSGDVTVHSNGRLTINASGGRQYGVRADGTISSYRDTTRSVVFNPQGRVTSLRTSNLQITHERNGSRTITSRSADSTVVSTGRHSGYVERNVTVGSRTYIQRTTIINNRILTTNFVGFGYHGLALHAFVAPYFYPPAFYGWAFYPWAAPIHFEFGWSAAPWYAGPDPYFTAYPVYPGAASWLTDYLIGGTLAAAHDLEAEDAAGDMESDPSNAPFADAADSDASGSGEEMQAETATPITPELKYAIADEVKQELSYDNAASAANKQETGDDQVSTLLSRPNQVFVVFSNLQVATVDQELCALQPGDILRLENPPAENFNLAELRVASSQRMDCPANMVVTVSVSDLQEMQNNFRAQVEAGLGNLQAGQGHNGIPAAPADAVAAPPRPNADAVSTDHSANSAAVLDQLRKQADQAEEQAAGSAF
jgi:hypothetical protein